MNHTPHKFKASQVILNRSDVEMVERELQCIKETLHNAYNHIESDEEWSAQELVDFIDEISSSMNNIHQVLD